MSDKKEIVSASPKVRKLARDLRDTQKALTFKEEDILSIEKPEGGYERYRSK